MNVKRICPYCQDKWNGGIGHKHCVKAYCRGWDMQRENFALFLIREMSTEQQEAMLQYIENQKNAREKELAK